jgi:hypothetical protein
MSLYFVEIEIQALQFLIMKWAFDIAQCYWLVFTGMMIILFKLIGNISSGNRPLHANYENFNLSHTMLIQRRSHGRWKGWFAKSPLQITPPTSHEFCKSPLPPSMRSPLDQHFVNHILKHEMVILGSLSLFPQKKRILSLMYIANFEYIREFCTCYYHILYWFAINSLWMWNTNTFLPTWVLWLRCLICT